MPKYNLTLEQKRILKVLVDAVEAGELRQPIITSCTSLGCSIIGLDESFGHNLNGDLDALADLDLLGARPNSRGNLIYTLKQAAFEAIQSDFEKPPNLVPNLNVGAVIQSMEGGTVQAVGFADHSQVEQIVSDPHLLDRHFEELSSKLIDAVKAEIDGSQISHYVELVKELKHQISSDSPDPTTVKQILQGLAFLGDVEGSIDLVSRVWPYLYPLVVIAGEALRTAN